MSSACTPILVGVVSPVSEIWLPIKNGQISLSGMDYSPWSSKNLIDRNWLKNSCKQGSMSRACTPVLVGVTPPVSEIWLPIKNSQISLSGHGL